MKTLIIIITATWLLTGLLPAAEPSLSPIRDASFLLNETELRVLTQQYEKTLTLYYDAQMQQNLMEHSARPKQLSDEARRALDNELQGKAQYIKALAEWSDYLRTKIESKVEELRKRAEVVERQRRAETAPTAPPPAKRNQSSSPSERAPQPQL